MKITTILFSLLTLAIAAPATTVVDFTEPQIDKFLTTVNGSATKVAAQNFGWARVHNNCGYDVYLWSVLPIGTDHATVLTVTGPSKSVRTP